MWGQPSSTVRREKLDLLRCHRNLVTCPPAAFLPYSGQGLPPNHADAEENILDDLHPARPAGRYRASFLVGLRRHPPNPLRLMVVRLPQRLVLAPQDTPVGSVSPRANDMAVFAPP